MHTKSTALLYLLYPTYILWGVVTYILWGAFQNFYVEIQILCVNPIKMKDLDTKSLEKLPMTLRFHPFCLAYPGCANIYEKSINFDKISGIQRQKIKFFGGNLLFSQHFVCADHFLQFSVHVGHYQASYIVVYHHPDSHFHLKNILRRITFCLLHEILYQPSILPITIT